jgi:hypothetical protein
MIILPGLNPDFLLLILPRKQSKNSQNNKHTVVKFNEPQF